MGITIIMPKSTDTTINTITIDGMSHEGRGIAHENGKKLFILGALPEETVTFQFLHQHRRYGEGIATDVITPSSDRVAAPCPHFLTCGGCSLQHLNNRRKLLLNKKYSWNNCSISGMSNQKQSYHHCKVRFWAIDAKQDWVCATLIKKINY